MLFIDEVATYVRKYAPQYGICVYSPIIAQACKESGFGRSELAIKTNNILGIKLKPNRTPIAIGGYNHVSGEEYKMGEITYKESTFCKFNNIEECVIGYFQFISSSSRYDNLKGITDPKEYCKLIKADGYATGSNYDNSLWNDYICQYNLTHYDKIEEEVISNMEIVNSLLTKNPCYTAGKKIEVKGLMLHSVGCPQPKASAFTKNWNSPSYDRACVHAFIDGLDGKVYQCLPWNHRGWHGGGSSNNTHIGVEMCEPDTIKYTGGSSFTCTNKNRAIEIAKRTYTTAVELFAYLCKEYKLDPLAKGVIVSHAEGHKMGIASNHGDPEHLWKGLGLSYTMDGFRQDVKNAMNPPKPAQPTDTKVLYRVQIGAYSVKANADAQLAKVKKAGFTDAFITKVNNLYKVQVGAYSVKANADNMLAKVKAKGFDAFITKA